MHTAIVGLTLWTMTGKGLAAEPQDDKWQFGVTVPLWAAGIEGDVTVRGVKSDLDVGFDDLADHLDAVIRPGGDGRA